MKYVSQGKRKLRMNYTKIKNITWRSRLNLLQHKAKLNVHSLPRSHDPLTNLELSCMVGEMVQNSQSLYSFTFNALIDIHEYIYSHSTTEFTFKKYIYSHLPVYFLFTIIFAHIYEMSSFTFNELYPFAFTIEIFIQHFLRITFAHQYKIPTAEYGLRTTDWV